VKAEYDRRRSSEYRKPTGEIGLKDYEDDLIILEAAIDMKIERLPFRNGRIFLRHVKQLLNLGPGLSNSLIAILELAKDPTLKERFDRREGTRMRIIELQEPSAQNPTFTIKTKGVPQGCPTSCGLSTMILDVLTRNVHRLPNKASFGEVEILPVKVVMYADDGIIFSHGVEYIEAVKNYLESVKIGLKKEGCGYVKEEGK